MDQSFIDDMWTHGCPAPPDVPEGATNATRSAVLAEAAQGYLTGGCALVGGGVPLPGRGWSGSEGSVAGLEGAAAQPVRLKKTSCRIPDGMNSRVFSGGNFGLAASSRASIFHWHGYKPQDAQAWYERYLKTGLWKFVSPPFKANRAETLLEAIHEDRCSPQAYFSLYTQFERLLRMATTLRER